MLERLYFSADRVNQICTLPLTSLGCHHNQIISVVSLRPKAGFWFRFETNTKTYNLCNIWLQQTQEYVNIYLVLGTYTKTWFWFYHRCQGRHVSNTYKIYHYISLVGIKIALDVREIVGSTFNEKVQVDVCYQTFFIISFFCWLLNLYNEIVQFLFNGGQDWFFIVFCLQHNVQHNFPSIQKKSLYSFFLWNPYFKTDGTSLLDF